MWANNGGNFASCMGNHVIPCRCWRRAIPTPTSPTSTGPLYPAPTTPTYPPICPSAVHAAVSLYSSTTRARRPIVCHFCSSVTLGKKCVSVGGVLVTGSRVPGMRDFVAPHPLLCGHAYVRRSLLFRTLPRGSAPVRGYTPYRWF